MVVIKAKLSPAPLLTLAAPQFKEILNSANDVLKLKMVLLTGSPVTSSEENLKLKTIIKVSLFGEHLRSWSSQLDFTVRGSHQFRILSRSVSKLKMISYYFWLKNGKNLKAVGRHLKSLRVQWGQFQILVKYHQQVFSTYFIWSRSQIQK